ncbi:MAG: diadenylate cyclase CdaA [Bacteroidales bacterium]|nr:diadenylate cyclase CdaA [Bacteroidales bacterium]
MLTLYITTFIEIHLLDVIDIFLVALLLYGLYKLLKGTVAINILFGIVAVYLIWNLVKALEMDLLGEILGAFISVGFIALIVVFQPEIRKFLLLLGTPSFINRKRKRFLFWKLNIDNTLIFEIDKIINACKKMAQSKTGALIVIANINELKQYIETGEIINANISEQLIENIFFKNSPLHDGAVIIFKNKIKAARCILPLSKNQDISSELGLRHRAAIGVTEQSDALAIIVSEQTGNISYSKDGKIKTNIQSNQLKNFLETDIK